LRFFNENGEIICDTVCIQGLSVLSTFLGGLFVLIVGIRSWKELKDQALIAGIHHLGISSEYVTRPTIENMSRAIEQNDWQTAEEWSKIVENEFSLQKGKKEQLIENLEQIYQPLYMESSHNETAGKEMKRVGEFRYFQRDEWIKISSGIAHLRIEDERLKNDLGSFYAKIEKFNDFPDLVTKVCERITRKRLEENYGENIRNLHYYVKTIKSTGAPNLSRLLPFGRHPLEVYPSQEKPQRAYIDLDNEKTRQYQRLESEKDFEKFEQVFQLIKQDAETEPVIKQTRMLYEEITIENKQIRDRLLVKIKKASEV